MANNGRFEYTIGFKTDKTGLQQAKKALQEIQNLTTKTPGYENMSAELGEAKKAAADFESALTRAFNVKLKTTDVSKLRDELQQLDLNSMYKSLSAIGPKGEEAFNRMAVQAMKTNLQIRQSNIILQRFGTTLRRNIEWMLSGQVIKTVTGVFQKAYGFTKNLDSSLNDIRIVTGKSADEMNRLGQEAQKTAAALSKGTTDITNASLIFYQQGLDTEEANARTEVATKLANVTKQDTDVTADQLTAVWNGYKATNDELERYADIMTAVAANTASSSSELSGAISKVASVANTTGVNMEQLTAMMSTVISVTRESPEAVGTAFKTIFARINDLVEDGTDEFGVSLGRISSHLKAMGIEILDENGNLKDLGDTLSKVGNDWSQYSREQQIAIAEQIGGKRQWNQVVALFDNWNKYSEALDVARNSTGELQKQQDIYAESTAAHLQAVKTAWEGVYSQLMSSDDINKVADFFTAVLEKVEVFIKNIGGIGPILQMVAGYMLQAFGPQIGQQMATTINNLRIMKDNASQMAAQQDLTRILGTVEDNALMQKLVKQHQQILKYKNLMTEANRKEYEEYLEQTVALDKKQKDLENEVRLTEKALEGRKELSKTYQESGNTVDSASFPMQTVDEGIEAATTFLKNRSVETDKGVERIGTPQVKVLDNITDLRIKQINKYLEELSKIENTNPRVVREFEKLSSALTSVSDDFIKTSAQGKINIGSLQSHEDQARRAATALLKLGLNEKNVTAILKQFTAAEGENTQFYEENTQALTKSQESIQKYIRIITELESRQVLTTEQAEQLRNELTRIRSDTASLEDYTNGIRNINSQLTHFVRNGLQDLEQVSKAAGEHLDVQQKNVKNSMEAWDGSLKNLFKNLDITNIVNSFTQLANLASQTSMIFSQISNIKNVIADENVKTSEKISKVFSSLIFILPSVINLVKQLGERFFVTATAEAQATRQAFLEDLQSKQRQSNLAKETLLIKRKELAQAESAMAQAAQNLADKEAELVQNQYIVGARERTEAELEQAKATYISTKAIRDKAKEEARLALTSSREANSRLIEQQSKNLSSKISTAISGISSFTLWSTVIMAVVAAITIMVQKIKAAKEEAEEARKQAVQKSEQLIQTNNNLIESNKKAIKSYDDYQKAWDLYKKGALAQKEFNTQLDEMIEQLGLSEDPLIQHARLIADTTNNYKELNAAIDEAIESKKQQNVTFLNDNIDAIKTDVGSLFIENEKKNKNYTMDSDVSFLTMLANFNTRNEQGVLSSLAQDIGGGQIRIDWSQLKNLSQEQAADAVEQATIWWKNKKRELDERIQQAQKDNNTVLVNQLQEDLDEYQRFFSQISSYGDRIINQELIAKDYELGTEKSIGQHIHFSNIGEDEEELRRQMLQYAQVFIDAYAEYEEELSESDAYLKVESAIKELFPEKTSILGRAAALNDAILQAKTSINTTLASHGQEEIYSQLVNWDGFDAALSELKKRIETEGFDFSTIDWSVISGNDFIKWQDNGLTDKFFNKIIENTEKAEPVVIKLTQDYDALWDTFNNVSKKIEKSTLSERNLRSNKAFQSLVDEEVLDNIKQFYGEISEVGHAIEVLTDETIPIGSQKWKEAWRIYGEAIENAGVISAIQQVDDALLKIEKDRKGNVKVHADARDYAETMDEILATDYNVDVEIHTRVDKAVEGIKSDLKDMSDLVAKIDDGFTLSANELDDFAEKMPSILTNMQVLSDGTIQLSQAAVEEAKKQALEESNAKIDGEIQVIQAQKAVVEHKKETADEMLKIATEMSEGEFKNKKALDNAMGRIDELALDLQKDNQIQSMLTAGQIDEKRLEALSKFYSAGLKQAQEYRDKRNEILNNPDLNIVDQSFSINDYAEDLGYTFEDYNLPDEAFKYGANREDYIGLTKESLQNEIDLGEALMKIFQDASDSYQHSIDEFQSQIDILNSYKTNISSIWDSVEKTKKTTKDKTSKDKAAAQAQLIELLNEEIDAYHDINIEIKQLETQMARLQKQQAKLTGDALIKNLEKQLELLYKQNDAYNRKLELTTMDLAINRSSLESSGVTFNEDGTIANYAEALAAKMQYVQDIQNQYNNMSKEEQDGFKDTVDQAKKDYDNFKNNISEYDKLLTEEIPSLQDKIQELFDQKIEIEISKLQTEIQVVLDEKSFERTRIEFKKKMASIKEEDLLGNNIIDFNILATYTANDGSLVKARQRLEDLRRYQAELDSGNYATPYGDNAAKLAEDLKAAEEEWMNQEEAVKDLADVIKNRLVTALDQAGEKLEEQRQAFSQISDILEHNITLLQLRFGDTAFDKINNLLIEHRKLVQNQLSVALQERQFFKEQMDRLIEQDPNMVEDATKKAVEKYKESMVKVGELTNSVAQAMQKEFENSIQAIFQKLNEELTNGVGLDAIKSSWDRLTEGADEYYDIINSAYEVSKLRNQIEKAINESDNPTTQKALSQFLDEQITALEKKEKLSKYDIDRANALFEIEVKRAAFQEAQQNKSKMRLRRDAQGNYTYQFVSDEEQVANAMQELAEAQNKLYNIDKEGLRNNLNGVQTLLKEYQDAIVDDAKTGGKNREEITAYYEERINDKLKDSEDIRRNLTETALEEYARMTDQSVENLKNMSDQQRDILMNQLVPEYGGALDQMVQKMAGEGGFYAVMGGAFEEIARKTREYFSGLDDLADSTDMSFDTMIDGSIAVIDAMESLMDSTDSVMDKIKNTTEQILAMAMAISGSPQDLRSALEAMNLQLPDIASVIADATDILIHFNDAADAVVDAANNTNNDTNSNNNNNNTNNNNNNNNNTNNNDNNTGSNTITGLDKNRDDWGEDNLPNIGDEVIYLGDDYYYAPDGSGPSGRRGEGENKVVTVENISPGSEYPIAVKSHDSAYGWLKKYQIAKMKVGGYTGDWDDNKGRLAVLHQKELVLNADRTKALMDTFDVLTGKRVSNIGNDILSSVEDKIRQATQEVIRGSIAAIIDKVYHYNQEKGQKENIIERPVNINATFPNVVSALEVEKALNDLMNLSTQAAYNTHR